MVKKQILGLYLFFKYNFFKVKKFIERNFEENLEKTLDNIYKKLPVKLEEIFESYKINYEQIEESLKVFFEEDFPKEFYENDAGVIFYKGNWKYLSKEFFKIAIVGSRKPLNLSTNFVIELIKELTNFKEIVVVSGLASGIDSIALKNSISNGFKTIAILGNGIYYYYPYQNRFLQQKISKDGLLISEYLPYQKPQKYFFPYRNRLIACVSDIVIVMQARRNSGSIITGKYALEMGKNLFVPFLSTNEEFEGSKELINNGAVMVTKPKEIIEYLEKINKLTKEENFQKLGEDYKLNEAFKDSDDFLINKFLELVYNNPGMTLDKISEIINVPLPEVVKIATLLEIQEKITIDFNYSIFPK